LADDLEYVSDYEQNGFYPALSADPAAQFHVYSTELMDSIKEFFNTYISGVDDFTRLPVLQPRQGRQVVTGAILVMPGETCTQEVSEGMVERKDEIRELLQNSREWLESLLHRFVAFSKKLDEKFLRLLDPRLDSPEYSVERDSMRDEHNRQFSLFLRNVRAARRQIRTFQGQIVEIEQIQNMVQIGIEYAEGSPNTVFTVSNVGGFITIGGRERNLLCGTAGCFCRYTGKPHKRFRDRRGSSRNIIPGLTEDLCRAEVVYAHQLSATSPFHTTESSAPFRVTVLDDSIITTREQDKVEQAIAKGEIKRMMSAEKAFFDLVKFWFEDSSWYTERSEEIKHSLTEFLTYLTKLPYPKQTLLANSMSQEILAKIGVDGRWYYHFDRVKQELKDTAHSYVSTIKSELHLE
jgi:hypothetical protein